VCLPKSITKFVSYSGWQPVLLMDWESIERSIAFFLCGGSHDHDGGILIDFYQVVVILDTISWVSVICCFLCDVRIPVSSISKTGCHPEYDTNFVIDFGKHTAH
jgi:hypothetical protein